MPASTLPRRHRLRWIAAAIIVLLAVLVLALALYVHTLLQPRRFTAHLQGELAAMGLTLELQAPAKPMLFPHPGARLYGLTLSNTGANTPLLKARRAVIVVPWRTLLQGSVAIESVIIDSPRIDLEELQALLARLPHHAGPPRLPSIATGIRMRRGTLVAHGTPLLFGLSLDTGALAPNRSFRLDASARTASGRDIALTLTTVPSATHDGAIQFKPAHLIFDEQGGTSLNLHGYGSWRGGEDFRLHMTGSLRHAALTPAPATSAGGAPAGASASSGTATDKVVLGVTPPHGKVPMSIAVKLDGPNTRVDLHLRPGTLEQWWNQILAAKPGRLGIPMPFTGSATIPRLDFGAVQAQGIHIEAGPQVMPAPVGTIAPAPPTMAP